MTEKITPVAAQREFNQILDRAERDNDRFVIERDGKPIVLMLSVADFMNAIAPTPVWMQEIQAAAAESGASELTAEEIDAEIRAVRAARVGR